MREQLILGNWKMHGSTAMVNDFFRSMQQSTAGVGISVPSLYVPQAISLCAETPVLVGAQNVSEHSQGAYTGCTSAQMLADIGCDFCLIGHSERRQYQQESDTQIAEKIHRLNEQGIRPVLCVGENLQQRDQNQTIEVVVTQISACVQALAQATKPVIAYEPIWAIGTGRTASDEQAQEVHAQIRKFLAHAKPELIDTPILYGGSVKPDNAQDLLAQADIDGALVGGASLQPESLLAIAAGLPAVGGS